ncbi:MAG: 3-phosphoshikimate 1-carboxyvinyltransferase [Candidatus Eremiobacteraeota bacterium]|nr:3-phosphoshikimate 1-carboxyvinyltransferase [Candidatus Eremiobacteraeota bacterium]
MPGKVATFHPGPLRGDVGVPGDKSISHRALIVGARCAAPLRIANLNPGRDVQATRRALIALGVGISEVGGDVVVRPARLRSPDATLDCMNSGSTARMLLGACSGANVAARFDGDASLRRRPMEPVAAQLRAFGAKIETSNGHLPLELSGTPEVETRRFILLAPSAQVKSALLFAGLFAGVPVRVDGDRGSRDHTERLLDYLGARIEWTSRFAELSTAALASRDVAVAGDVSAAAFFVTAAAITPGSAITVRDVGVNPLRTGLFDALRAMGASIGLSDERLRCGEPLADVAVEYRPLTAAPIGADLALRAIDEIPLLAVAAAFATGTTTIDGIGDLRSKESDRVAAIERLLAAVGTRSVIERHRLAIVGGTTTSPGALVATHDDHRIAMAAAVLGCAAGPLAIDDDESLDVSFPGFMAALERLRDV